LTHLNQTFEKILIEEALLFTKGRRIEAAEMLGLGRNTLTRKVKEFKIEK
jgi:two-component system nitrogen regulation response regulator GlnG